MDEITRKKMLMVWDSNELTLPLLHQMRNHVRYREIIAYLYRNDILGSRLIWYYQGQKNSILNLMADILRRVDGNREKSKIHVKDMYGGRR